MADATRTQQEILAKALDSGLTRDEIGQAVEAASGGYYYSQDQQFDDKLKKWVIEEALRWVRPGRVLDLGYINSIWTYALLDTPGVTKIDIVEGAQSHAEQARNDFAGNGRVAVHHMLFENYETSERYDTILMSGVVKHVVDDVGLVRRMRSLLKPDGVMIASTPNCLAFHRRLGAYMGLESNPGAHNNRDRSVFNVHIYDRFSWRALFTDNGYDVVKVTGVGLKPFSTEQLIHLGQKYDIDHILEGLRHLGDELQDYAWYIVLVAHLNESAD